LQIKNNYNTFERQLELMERTKDVWAQTHYPPTENEIKYNKMILDYNEFDVIVQDVMELTHTNDTELYSKTKDNHVTFSRYLIYYLAKETNHRLNSIVRYMKGKGFDTTPSTVVYGIKQVEEKIKQDEKLQGYVSEFLVRNK